MLRRFLVLLTALLAVGVSAPAGAATLTGVTQLSGSQAGWIDVDVPHPIDTSGSQPPFSVTWSGPGALKGVALVGAPYTVFSALPSHDGTPSPSWASSIPAGTYRLYLITAGQPLDLELRIPSLGTSTAALAVEHPIAVEGGTFSTRTDGDGRVVGGRTVRMATSGMVWGQMSWVFPSGARGDAGTCVYLPGHEHDRPDEFSAGCPGTGQQQVVPQGFSSGSHTVAYEGGGAERGARYGFGANARSTQGGVPTVSGEAWAINLALPVEPDPFPYPAGSPYAPPPQDRPATGAPSSATAAPSTAPRPADVLPVRTVRSRADRFAIVPVACPGPARCRVSVSAGTRPTTATVAAGTRASVRVLLTVADRRRLRAGRSAQPRVKVAIRGARAVRRTLVVRPAR